MKKNASTESPPTYHQARLANLLGAAVIGLGDDIRNSNQRILAREGATAAALAVVGHHPGLSVQKLNRILEMSHPGTVRLLDSLTAANLVDRRRSTKDTRIAELYLTAQGTILRQEILRERQLGLEAAISQLSATEMFQLEGILEKILVALPREAIHGETICRFCDEASCADCPIEMAIG